MEVYIRRSDDDTYLAQVEGKLAKLSIEQKALVIDQLKPNCVNCPANGNGCASMLYIDRKSVLVDQLNKYITVDNCPAENIPVQV